MWQQSQSLKGNFPGPQLASPATHLKGANLPICMWYCRLACKSDHFPPSKPRPCSLLLDCQVTCTQRGTEVLPLLPLAGASQEWKRCSLVMGGSYIHRPIFSHPECLWVAADLHKPASVNCFSFSSFPFYHRFAESWWSEMLSSRGKNINLKVISNRMVEQFYYFLSANNNNDNNNNGGDDDDDITWGCLWGFHYWQIGGKHYGFRWTGFPFNWLEHFGMKRWERQVLNNRTNLAASHLHNFV